MPSSSTSSAMSSAQSPLGAQVLERLGVLRRGGHAERLERGERDDPRRDRRGERLAEERAQRLVLPALDVARAPVVDEHEAEDVLGGRARRDRRPERVAGAGDEAELELDVEPLRRAERGRAAGLGGRELAARAAHRRARDHDRARPAVVADRQVTPVRQQRVAVGAEHAPQVGRVLERRVEVDVVAHLEREPDLDLRERHRAALRRAVREPLLQRGAQRRPGLPAEREQRVEHRARQRSRGNAGRGQQAALLELAEQHRLVAEPHGELRRLAVAGDRAVGEVLEAEAAAHRPHPTRDRRATRSSGAGIRRLTVRPVDGASYDGDARRW